MASKQKELEKKCYIYLKDAYGENNIIDYSGNTISNEHDIKIITSNGKEFYIEIKANNSYCCQFVLFPNKKTNKFEFSKNNKIIKSDNCQNIINYMNSNYEQFCKVSKKSIPINIDNSLLYGFVNDYYALKNIQFYMSESDNLLIIPADKFSVYFDIKAFYHRRSSGTTEPNKKNNNEEIIQGLNEESIYGTVTYETIQGKKRCFLHSDELLDKRKLACNVYTYQFINNSYSKSILKQKTYSYEIRKLSRTNNPKVICQLSLKKLKQEITDLQTFEKLVCKEE